VEDGPVVFVVELLVETQYRLQCTKCQKLVHRKCSGIKSSMIKVRKSFVCRGCTDKQASVDRISMDICDGVSLVSVNTFCYLGEMLSVDSDADAVEEARVCKRWIKFRQLVPLLTNNDVSLLTRGK